MARLSNPTSWPIRSEFTANELLVPYIVQYRVFRGLGCVLYLSEY